MRTGISILVSLPWWWWFASPLPAEAAIKAAGSIVFSAQGSCCGDPSDEGLRFGEESVVADFDGDGHNELVIGVPGATRDGQAGAGAVVVMRGGPDGPSVVGQVVLDQAAFATGTNSYEDRFGAELAVGRFDADGCDDLAVAAPWDSLEEDSAAGSVYVLYGCAGGGALFRNDSDHFTIANLLGAGFQQSGDRFGADIVAGDFDGDGLDDLAAGAPGDGLGGRLLVVYAHPNGSGLSGLGEQYIHRSLTTIPGVEQADEELGRTLASGDFNGDGIADLAVGAPSRDVGATLDVGEVVVILGSIVEDGLDLSTATAWSQGAGLAGAPETSNHTGSALAAGDFDGDGTDDLAIGSPYEDVGTLAFAGAVNILHGMAGSGLIGPGTIFTQDSLPNLEAEADELFGWALAAADFDRDGADDLVIGTVAEDVEVLTQTGWLTLSAVGSTHLISGLPGTGLALGSARTWIGSPSGLQQYENFGSGLAVGDLGHGPGADLVAAAVHRTVGGEDAGIVTVMFSSLTIFRDGFESGDLSAWD